MTSVLWGGVHTIKGAPVWGYPLGYGVPWDATRDHQDRPPGPLGTPGEGVQTGHLRGLDPLKTGHFGVPQKGGFLRPGPFWTRNGQDPFLPFCRLLHFPGVPQTQSGGFGHFRKPPKMAHIGPIWTTPRSWRGSPNDPFWTPFGTPLEGVTRVLRGGSNGVHWSYMPPEGPFIWRGP